MYQSPIEIITKQMRTQFEDNVFKAIQDYGIVVDKEELLKALQYDRGQYEKGYSDGLLASRDEWISVDERLPEKHKNVLTFADGVIRTDFICSSGVWYDHAYNYGKVTHWMPLPEAPKGGAE